MPERSIYHAQEHEDLLKSEWNHHPHLHRPIKNNPLFEWPTKPVEIFTWLQNSWLTVSQHLLLLGLSVCVWLYLRFLHWPPLFKLAHSLHHRNVNIRPWSGLSMHPVEHAIYMSSVLIHFIVASHPVHIFFHMHWLTIPAVTSHVGFESLLIRDKAKLHLGLFITSCIIAITNATMATAKCRGTSGLAHFTMAVPRPHRNLAKN